MTSSRSSLRTWRHTWIILSRMTSSLRRPYTRYRHRTPLPAPWRQPMTGSETKHFFDTQTELGKKPHERCVTPHIPHSNLLAKCAFTLFVWYFETKKKQSRGTPPSPISDNGCHFWVDWKIDFLNAQTQQGTQHHTTHYKTGIHECKGFTKELRRETRRVIGNRKTRCR